MHLDLFDEQSIDLIDGQLKLFPALLSADEAEALLQVLLDEIDWQSETIYLYGREVLTPRLTAWYGDAGSSYRYSGVLHEPQPWTDSLQVIRQRVEATLDMAFNSVLLNLYRDGSDSVAWHSDDEPELGPEPNIASVTLGQERVFQIRHKQNKQHKHVVKLPPGSLLLMQGRSQADWQHQVPKSRQPMLPRINLTFRQVL
ncbi:MAG: alpha-ketoglutarate-dependent dioxygenase AlkB [Chromatiales bacterium]|jgi:alkylated DNA repair dioxygenase AlkB